MSPEHRNGPATPTPQISPSAPRSLRSGEVLRGWVLFFKEVGAGVRSREGGRNANLYVVGCA